MSEIPKFEDEVRRYRGYEGGPIWPKLIAYRFAELIFNHPNADIARETLESDRFVILDEALRAAQRAFFDSLSSQETVRKIRIQENHRRKKK